MTPRKLLARLVAFLLPADHREFILGDLRELYVRRRRERGSLVAGARYLWDLLRSVPGLLGRRDPTRSPGPRQEGPFGGAAADARHAVRGLRRRPRYTALVVLTLGLGIGPAMVVFGMVHTLLLSPLPGVGNTEEAVHVQIWARDRPGGVSQPDTELLRRRLTRTHGLATYGNVSFNVLTDEGRPFGVRAHAVYGDYFEVLGTRPSAGRLLDASATRIGADPFVVVISEDLRDRLFGRAIDPVGSTLRVGEHDLTIIGVTADGFRGPLPNRPKDAWLPLSSLIPLVGFSPDRLGQRSIGRNTDFLALPTEGTTPEALEGEISTVLRQIGGTFPGSAEQLSDVGVQVLPGLHMPPNGRESTMSILTLMGWSVALMLIIACANVANLMLFRNLTERGAIATQRVLGASSGQIARRKLVESLILGLMGAVWALLLAQLIFLPFRGWALPGTAAIEELPLSPQVVLFAGALGLAVAMAFGLVPAFLAGRFNLSAALRSSRMNETGRLGWLRTALAAGQLGLTVALCVGGLMMVRTLVNLRSVETGLDIDGVVRTWLDPDDVPEDRRLDRQRALLSAVRDLPGVQRAALDEYGPHASRRIGRVARVGELTDETPLSLVWYVSPGWFDLFGVEPLHGRVFDDTEWTGEPQPLAVVTASLARRLFGRTDVVGQTLVLGRSVRGVREGREADPIERRIVGVVGDYRPMYEPETTRDAVFLLYGDSDPSSLTLLVKTERYSREWAASLLSTVEDLFPEQPVPEPVLIEDDVGQLLEDQRLLGHLFTILAVFAGLMSATGLYGVVYFLVSSRMREFGIRIALGADRRRVMALVGRFVASMWSVGIVLGLAGAAWLSSLLESQLFGLEPMDPLSIVFATTLLCLVCLLASLMPARAALRADPVEVLRQE